MATHTRKSTADRTASNNQAASPRADPASDPTEKDNAKRGATHRRHRASPPAQRFREAAPKPRHKPYQMEIAALADTTAELPPPWRERAIQIVHAIVGLFERAWRELSHRPAPAASDADEASNPSDAAGPASLG